MISWGQYDIFNPGVTQPLNGYEVDRTDAGIQVLNDFYRENIHADEFHPELVAPEWMSVAVDVGLFIGDTAIGRHPNLHWALHTWGKKNAYYHREVVVGFTQVSVANYSSCPFLSVAMYGNLIAMGPAPVQAEVRGTTFDFIPPQPDEAMFLRVLAGIETNA